LEIRINYNSAYDAGDKRHSQEIMKSLGIKYGHGTPHPIGDCWIFSDVDEKTIPKELPAYVEILKPIVAFITFAITEGEVYFPAQCSCGHIIQEKYFVKIDETTVRPFSWCGFCRTRVDLPDRPGKIYVVDKLAPRRTVPAIPTIH
jgi:hypothetical protein